MITYVVSEELVQTQRTRQPASGSAAGQTVMRFVVGEEHGGRELQENTGLAVLMHLLLLLQAVVSAQLGPMPTRHKWP